MRRPLLRLASRRCALLLLLPRLRLLHNMGAGDGLQGLGEG